MTEHEASRTLVKSPPELWAECSDSAALTRHLGEFGQIRVTRLEPEIAVAWEGQRASGTVRLEPSGWGTRVTLTAREVSAGETAVDAAAVADPASEPETVPAPDPDPEPETASVPDPEPDATYAPDPDATEPAQSPEQPHPGFLARLRAALRRKPPGPPPAADLRAELPVEVEVEVGDAEPEAAAVPQPAQQAATADPPSRPDPEAVLTAALESLGQAHHRPYSRA